ARDGAQSRRGLKMSNPINLYLTKDIGLLPLELWVTSLVGAMVRIVYGRVGATHAPGSAQASGPARSRTYITNAGTASASADFLSALPMIPRFPHGDRERARRVRHLHHHLLGAGSVHLPALTKRLWPAHGPRTTAL